LHYLSDTLNRVERNRLGFSTRSRDFSVYYIWKTILQKLLLYMGWNKSS